MLPCHGTRTEEHSGHTFTKDAVDFFKSLLTVKVCVGVSLPSKPSASHFANNLFTFAHHLRTIHQKLLIIGVWVLLWYLCGRYRVIYMIATCIVLVTLSMPSLGGIPLKLTLLVVVVRWLIVSCLLLLACQMFIHTSRRRAGEESAYSIFNNGRRLMGQFTAEQFDVSVRIEPCGAVRCRCSPEHCPLLTTASNARQWAGR